MTFLSRAFVHKQVAARNRLRDSYAWHRSLWDVFPGRKDEKRDFLFRLDDQRSQFQMLLLSSERPVIPDWGRWETKTVPPAFLNHDRYRFQIKANPTMRRSSDRRRIGIYSEPGLHEWIARKALNEGFSIEQDTLAISAPLEEVFVRNGRRGKHVSVDFQGVLQVKDRAAFFKAFQKGIGSAKAFGFGLLMLQPL